jgi:hypothetical protein
MQCSSLLIYMSVKLICIRLGLESRQVRHLVFVDSIPENQQLFRMGENLFFGIHFSDMTDICM